MNRHRASYLKTVVGCATVGVLLGALAILGAVRGELRVAGRAVLTNATPAVWFALVGILAATAVLFLLVALGGTICILRDVDEERRG